MSRFAAVLIPFLLFLTPACAVKQSKKRRAKPAVYTVKPSEAIEQGVEAESEKAKAILAHLSASNLFASAYLSAAVYYHDGFLSDFPDEKPDADPARRIVARLERDLTPERKTLYARLLVKYWSETAPDADTPAGAFVVPVPYEAPAAPVKRKRAGFRRARRTHEFAVDLFTREGTPVLSATRGVVVVADAHWNPADPFSTTSQKGGNSVILFDPDGQRFLRYAHLDQVFVAAGDDVRTGEKIGTVGHSGLNASRPKHGRHLHLEVNELHDGKMRALRNAELWSLIRKAP